MNDSEAAHFYSSPDSLRAGARVTPTGRAKLTGHVPVRFPQSTIDQIKALASEDGTTVSTWIRKTVEKAIIVRTQPETMVLVNGNFTLDQENLQKTSTAVLA